MLISSLDLCFRFFSKYSVRDNFHKIFLSSVSTDKDNTDNRDEKAMSAPPLVHDKFPQALHAAAAPPSYNAAMGYQSPPPPAGYQGPPAGYPPGSSGPSQIYPTLPEKGGGPPSPQAMEPQPPPVQFVTQVQYVQGPIFGHRAVTMVCPHCQNNITTRTSSEPSALAWIIGGVLCFVGLWPCCCIPCCIDSLNQVTHSCPSCGNTLGRYKGGI